MDDSDPAIAALVSLVEEATGAEIAGLGDATLVGRSTAASTDDASPAARVSDLLADADAIVGVVPRIESALVDRIVAADGELTASIVLTGRARERLTGPVRVAARSALAERDVDAYAHDGDSPVGVLLVDDCAVVGLFEGAELAAILTTEAPPVREWAAATCRRYRAAAEPLFG